MAELSAANAAIRDEIVRRLHVYENVVSGEFSGDNVDLRDFAQDALLAHSPDIEWVAVPEKELPLIALRARINLLTARLARNDREYSVSSVGGSGDRSATTNAILQRIALLQGEYEAIASALGVGLGGDEATIHMGEMVRDEPILDRTVPLDTNPPPPKSVLTIYKQGTGYVSLRWTKAARTHDFHKYVLYRHTTAGLEDLTTINNSDAVHKGVVDDATKITEIFDLQATYYKDEVAAGTYYYVIVTHDESGRYAVSDEIEVEVS